MIEVRRGTDRSVTREKGRTTWHSFSFGEHYDPENIGFGPMVAHNDELLTPGSGYPEHLHSGVEIVTWVRSGRLEHVSSVGAGSVGPGAAQRLTAGSGVTHAETAPTGARFLQTWLRSPAETAPGYDHAAVPSGPVWARVAGADAALALATPGAALAVARPAAGESLRLPRARLLHLFVTVGSVRIAGHVLDTDDAARLTEEWSAAITAPSAAELLVWSFA